MKIQLTAKQPLVIQLTADFCKHTGVTRDVNHVVRWKQGTQDSKATSRHNTTVETCPSITLVPGVPSEPLHNAILNVPQVAMAIKAKQLTKREVKGA